jgi:hypothetical protein
MADRFGHQEPPPKRLIVQYSAINTIMLLTAWVDMLERLKRV